MASVLTPMQTARTVSMPFVWSFIGCLAGALVGSGVPALAGWATWFFVDPQASVVWAFIAPVTLLGGAVLGATLGAGLGLERGTRKAFAYTTPPAPAAVYWPVPTNLCKRFPEHLLTVRALARLAVGTAAFVVGGGSAAALLVATFMAVAP